MVTIVNTVAFRGIEAVPVEVQVQIASGMPAFTIVGLPDKAVAESRERVRSALVASGLGLPPKRITINLAPADLPKEGSHYDLPIALGLMAAIGAVPSDAVDGHLVLGELGLNGRLAPVAGTLPAAIAAHGSGRGIICPELNGPEAAWASDEIDIIAADNLLALVNHMAGHQLCSRPQPRKGADAKDLPDLSEVRGQQVARRALEVAAAGGHNLLMVGPPGSGKSMLAARLPSILPPLNARELLDVSMIQSIAGELAGGRLSDKRPWPRLWEVVSRSVQARSAWRTMAYYFSMNCRSSTRRSWTVCVNPLKAERPGLPGPTAGCDIRRGSSLSPQ